MPQRERWYHEWHMLRTIMRGCRLDPDIPNHTPAQTHVWNTVFDVLYTSARRDFPLAAQCHFDPWSSAWWRTPDERWKMQANLRLGREACEAHRLVSREVIA